MSTYMYLECREHNPPLRSHGEVGQHYYDLNRIFSHLGKREELIADCRSVEIDPTCGWEYCATKLNELGWNDLCPDRDDPFSGESNLRPYHRAYFTSCLARFVMEHPYCDLVVVTEYEEDVTREDHHPIPEWKSDLYVGQLDVE